MDRVRDCDTQARNVLERFSNQIGWVVDSVAVSFDLEPHFKDDLRQEANIRVLTYADLLEGWGAGRLFRWVKKTEGDENQVKALLGRQLRIDLSQTVSRQVGRTNGETMPMSLDEMVEEGEDPIDEAFESRTVERLDAGSVTDLHERYPYLALNVLDGFTQKQIAEANGITDRTVRNRINREKYAFLVSYVQKRGLRVEGDETLEELEEAYGHLMGVRR